MSALDRLSQRGFVHLRPQSLHDRLGPCIDTVEKANGSKEYIADGICQFLGYKRNLHGYKERMSLGHGHEGVRNLKKHLEDLLDEYTILPLNDLYMTTCKTGIKSMNYSGGNSSYLLILADL